MAGMLIPTSLWEATLDSPIGIFSAFPASDVKNIILDESHLVTDEHASFIQPFSVTASLTLPNEGNHLKFSALCDFMRIRYSSAMAECFRNFSEYFTNSRLWRILHCMRPHTRISSLLDRGAECLEKRGRLVQKWFRYALRFITEKRRILIHISKRQEAFEKLQNREKNLILAEGLKDIKLNKRSTSALSSNTSLRSALSMARKKPYNGERYFPKILE